MKVYVRVKPIGDAEQYVLSLDYEINLAPGDSIRLCKPGGFSKVLYLQPEPKKAE